MALTVAIPLLVPAGIFLLIPIPAAAREGGGPPFVLVVSGTLAIITSSLGARGGPVARMGRVRLRRRRQDGTEMEGFGTGRGGGGATGTAVMVQQGAETMGVPTSGIVLRRRVDERGMGRPGRHIDRRGRNMRPRDTWAGEFVVVAATASAAAA